MLFTKFWLKVVGCDKTRKFWLHLRIKNFFNIQSFKIHNLIKICKKIIGNIKGDVFFNPGSITDRDFKEIRNTIDKVKPSTFIEIGTGRGISTLKIYNYLKTFYPSCHFYTVEIYKRYYNNIKQQFSNNKTFHSLLGLSVRREETTNPAHKELKNYSGPDDILRKLLNGELRGKKIDIAFIDSRKGTALAEFLILKERLSKNGVILCHDVLNDGKGVEVLEYLKNHQDKFRFEIINTGPQGLLKIYPQ